MFIKQGWDSGQWVRVLTPALTSCATYPSRRLALCLSLPFCKTGLKEKICQNPSTLRFGRSVIPQALITAPDSPFLGGREDVVKAAGMSAGSPSSESFGALGQSPAPGTPIRPVFPQGASYFPPHFLFSPFGAPPLPLRDWPPPRGSGSTRRLGSPATRALGFQELRPRGGTHSSPARGEEERRPARGPPTRGGARPFGARPPPGQTGARREGERGSRSLARCQALRVDVPLLHTRDIHLRSLQDPGLMVENAVTLPLPGSVYLTLCCTKAMTLCRICAPIVCQTQSATGGNILHLGGPDPLLRCK
ncbi:unnamed protein product [Rangifer tarandus platyrhynchus]|uniref:Uncharacterized protein n=2 Tax=Rangifer tarandus platyrhynchus TaxID=3082113 RepID=A0ACB0FAR2_RANTA|nr:unnamed protein product [Rangifer tarandus platyrhynchus]CAI9709794.1 unnamed protein product [Rangifer tarandus platyrhynchus]